ncbi:MAG: hypothetical protein JW860_04745 [Sedimentisphaerales bacterium]|nr:hypothetical protein [Sedimentisphaerales bacterium]
MTKYKMAHPIGFFGIVTGLVLFISGCGPFYALFIDPLIPAPLIPAEHDMSDKHVLVWVERTESVTESPRSGDGQLLAPNLRRELTYRIQEELRQNYAVGSLVDYETMVSFRHQHPDLASLTIQQLGAAMPGPPVEQVFYILVNDFQLRQQEVDYGYYQASLGGYCKVVDVATGKRLWPTDQTYRSFHITAPTTIGQDSDLENEQVLQLSQLLAGELAPCFYEHREKKMTNR